MVGKVHCMYIASASTAVAVYPTAIKPSDCARQLLKSSSDFSSSHSTPSSTPRSSDCSSSAGDDDQQWSSHLASHFGCVASSCFADNSKSESRRNRHVAFGDVELRRYFITLGDNPSCRIGPPVSLGWEYEEFTTLPVDDYETIRQPKRRSRLHQLVLNMYQRQGIMNRIGIDPEEIESIEKEMKRIQRQRSITAALAPFSKVEEVMASAGRKVKRAFHHNN